VNPMILRRVSDDFMKLLQDPGFAILDSDIAAAKSALQSEYDFGEMHAAHLLPKLADPSAYDAGSASDIDGCGAVSEVGRYNSSGSRCADGALGGL